MDGAGGRRWGGEDGGMTDASLLAIGSIIRA